MRKFLRALALVVALAACAPPPMTYTAYDIPPGVVAPAPLSVQSVVSAPVGTS